MPDGILQIKLTGEQAYYAKRVLGVPHADTVRDLVDAPTGTGALEALRCALVAAAVAARCDDLPTSLRPASGNPYRGSGDLSTGVRRLLHAQGTNINTGMVNSVPSYMRAVRIIADALDGKAHLHVYSRVPQVPHQPDGYGEYGGWWHVRGDWRSYTAATTNATFAAALLERSAVARIDRGAYKVADTGYHVELAASTRYLLQVLLYECRVVELALVQAQAAPQ